MNSTVGVVPKPRLEKSWTARRTLTGHFFTTMAVVLSILAMWPLFSVLYMLISRGGAQLSLALFTELPPGAGMEGGGIGNAIVGTLVMTGLAAAISIPFGILCAVFLAETGKHSKVASTVRFSAKVMTGMPSILAGVFAYAIVVVTLGRFSALAGGVALAVLMLPTVILTAEEALKMVPTRMREAAFGMGATQAQVVMKVILPTAIPGVLTGVMLAVARAMGETAPLLFTALFSDFWFEGQFTESIASLAVLIYNFSGSPFENQINLAWAASLVLVVIVLCINLIAQFITRRPEER